MPSSIRTTVHESLPYIDKEPTESERRAAQALITTQLSSIPPPPHQTLEIQTKSNFSPLVESELNRISSQQPLKAIDLSRYEAPENSSTTPGEEENQDLETALSRAYTSHAYLGARQTNLQLLDAYGKNAWLVANWQTEGELGALERELAAAKKEIDLVNIQRTRLQDDVADELKGLEDTWRKGVGRVLETEAATETLRQQILERQRARA
ncbi:Pre-mRNA-splicing factor SPF27 [Poronia punctata]|nr:Pre-mRNA-splicing factor SPF27 [Poronia punctata]